MKRRLSALILLALLLCLLTGTAQGADLVFVAIDDTIPITLSGSAAPFYAQGKLYIPHTAFEPSALQVVSSYNAAENTLILFSRGGRLTFDLASGTMTSETGEVTQVTTYVRGGIVFLPAGYCATHFNFQIALLSSLSGYPILRFTTATKVYEDRDFVRYAENLISYRVSQYQAEHPVTPEPAPGPQEDPAPPSPPDDPPEDPETAAASVYLILTDANSMASALTVLARTDYPAAFFLSASEIRANAALVRRLLANGYAVGVTPEPGAQDPAASLAAANDALHLVSKTRTLFALLPAGQSPAEGYCTVTLPARRTTATEIAASQSSPQLLFCTGENLAAALDILKDANVAFQPLRETAALS